MAEELCIVFRFRTFSVEYALQKIQSVLAQHQISTTGFELYDLPVELSQVSTRLKRAARITFDLQGQGFEFMLGSVANFQVDFLSIKSELPIRIPWDTWALEFIDNPNFVMAWIVDAEYDFWQNAEDLLHYTVHTRPYSHLPQRSNDLPFPLEQTIIDISGNPGRRLFRNGYYEIVAAQMWLGEPFWQLTGKSRAAVEQADWVKVSHPLPNVLKLEATQKCFTTDEGVEANLQRRLRSLLFGVPGDQ